MVAGIPSSINDGCLNAEFVATADLSFSAAALDIADTTVAAILSRIGRAGS